MKKIRTIALFIALVLLMTGCAEVSLTADNTVTETKQISSEDLYSDRDFETDYDESDAVLISLTSDSVTITEEGTYIVQGTLEDGSIIIDAGDEDKVQLILDGCSISSASSAAIYVKNADKVFITTAQGSVNTLTNVTGFEADEESNIDGVIFSKSDLTLNGEGILIISSCDHGIVGKDDLVITSGEYEIDSTGDALQANDLIAISGGTFTINSGDDAIRCDADLVIDGGTIDILSSKEGLEGNTITINGGDITLEASDDGINTSGESGDTMMSDSSCQIYITGGTVSITTYGDGIDSNGDLTITGGYITVSGPENSGNGSLDYAGTGTITGGTIIAAGISGMEMNMTEATQGSILVSTGNQSAGTEITVTDASGNEIISFTPSTSYSCVLISSPELQVGQTYTISSASSSQDVTLDDYIYGQSMGFGGFGGGFGGPGGQMPDGQMPDMSDFDGQMPSDFNSERPELPEGSDGQTPPDLPEGFDGQTPPEPPSGR